MPRKSKENSKDKSKAKQKDHPQPILNVDLPETKPAPNSEPVGTWDTLGKDGDQDTQSKPSKTSGASREETRFRPDVLFDQDEVTPPPGRKKPTFKSMKHKLARSVGLSKSKGASNSEDDPQTPLSSPPGSQFPEDASNLDVHSTERVGSGFENIIEHPLSPNRVPTLESYLDLSEVKSGDTASQMQVQVSGSRQRNASPSSDANSHEPLFKTQEQSEDQSSTPRQESTEENQKQKERLSQAAQNAKRGSYDVLFKRQGEIRKLTTDLSAKETELKQLQEDLLAEKTARKELQTRLDGRDVAHNNHFEIINAAHEQDLKTKEASLHEALDQIKKEKRATIEELAGMKEQHKTELAVKEASSMTSMQLCITKETEIKDLKQQVKDKETESQQKLEHLELQTKNSHKQQLADTQAVHTQSVEDLKQQITDTQSQLENVKKMKNKFAIEAEQYAEDLCDQLETLSHRVQDLERDAQNSKELEIQIQNLELKLKEAEEMIKEQDETKAELLQAVELTKRDDPKAISENTDSNVKFKHIRDRYLDLTTKMVEKEEKYKKIAQNLREKIDDRDKQLKELRAGGTHMGPFTSPLRDPNSGGERLQRVIRDQEAQIQALEAQVRSFQEKSSKGLKVESERQQLQDHSKEQSRLILLLKTENERLKDFKDTLEDELQVLKGEVQGQLSNQTGSPPKKEKLARVLHADCEAKVGQLQAEIKEWKCYSERLDAKLQSQVDAPGSSSDKVLVVVPEDKEATITYLQKELTVHQEEIVQHHSEIKKLKQQLKDVKTERDSLQQQNLTLFAVKSDLKEQLSNMDQLKAQVSATRDTATSFADQVAAKTTEASDLKEQKEALQKEIDDLKGELEARKLQAQDYHEGFKMERQDRENMAGRIDDERAKIHIQLQLLEDKLESAVKKLEREQEKNTTLEVEKANLEAELTEQEAKLNELEESLQTFQGQLKHHERLYWDKTKEFEEDRKVKTEMILQYQQRQKQSEILFQQRQAELEQEANRLKAEADKTKAELTDVVIAQKLRLEEQFEHVESQFKLKEKQLEIMASENCNLEEQTGRMRAHCTAVQLELEDSRQQLDETIADTSRLSDEVLAKTQQVRQYKKQTDSYKAKLEETAARLQEAQRELQFQSEQVVVNKARVKELERHLSEHAACIRGLQQNVMRNREDNQALLAVNQQLQVTLSRAQRIQQRIDFMLKQTQAQLPPKQKAPPQYDERSLRQHAVRVRRAMKFDKPISEGSYGAVYAVEHDSKPCIAKRLHDILVDRNHTNPIDEQEKDGIHQKFVQECVLLSQIQHPNIVKFIGVISGRDKYDLTLLMERLSTDLQAYLLKNTNIPLSLKGSILHDISCGLLYLHERSIIHRDLSAANILLTTDSRAKIADLGVSRIFDRSVSQLSKLPGTLGYMPPEALKDRSVYDESIDIFSFGVLALYVAIQEFPEFSWENVPDAIIAKGEGEIYKRRSWIDKMNTKQPELSSLVLWCLQDDPMKRPSTFCLNILLSEFHP